MLPPILIWDPNSQSHKITTLLEQMNLPFEVCITPEECEGKLKGEKFRALLYLEEKKSISPLLTILSRFPSLGVIVLSENEPAIQELLPPEILALLPLPPDKMELKRALDLAEMEQTPIPTFTPDQMKGKTLKELYNYTDQTVNRDRMIKILQETQWNLSRAAKKLGITKQELSDKMAKLGVKKPIE